MKSKERIPLRTYRRVCILWPYARVVRRGSFRALVTIKQRYFLVYLADKY